MITLYLLIALYFHSDGAIELQIIKQFTRPRECAEKLEEIRAKSTKKYSFVCKELIVGAA